MGVPVRDLAREHTISTALIYQWRLNYSGMDAALMKRLKALEAGNTWLKKRYAEERIKAVLRQAVFEGKLLSHPAAARDGGLH